MKRVVFVVFAALLLGGCKSGPGRIELKTKDRDMVLDVKSGVMTASTRNWRINEATLARYEFILANFDLNSGADVTRPLSQRDEMRVSFAVFGAKGTNKDTPLEPGTFPIDITALHAYDNASLTIVYNMTGYQYEVTAKDYLSVGPDRIKGNVRINSVEGDTVKGEIDISVGKLVGAKGHFTAKIKPASFLKVIFAAKSLRVRKRRVVMRSRVARRALAPGYFVSRLQLENRWAIFIRPLTRMITPRSTLRVRRQSEVATALWINLER